MCENNDCTRLCGKHFMTLTEGYPIPKSKTGSLLQTLYLHSKQEKRSFCDSDAETGGNNDKYRFMTTVYESTIAPAKTYNNAESLIKPSDILIEPQNIKLIPASEWSPQSIPLDQIQKLYFTKRNGVARQFDIKLYNALCITKFNPNATPFIGVSWVDSCHFKVNESVFSKFLGGKTERKIFENQMSLYKYGFEQVYKGSNPRFSKNPECDDVDDASVRIFRDPLNRFSRDRGYTYTNH